MRPPLAGYISLRIAPLAALLALFVLPALLPARATADPYEWTRWGMPPSRTNFVQVYDTVRHRLVIHGGAGIGPDGSSDDTWSLDLNSTPAWQWRDYLYPRTNEVAVYDPPGDRIVIIGGTIDGETIWNIRTLSLGTFAWSGITTTGSGPPSPGYSPPGYAAAFDSQRRRMVMVGTGGDTYILDFTTNVWTSIIDPAKPLGPSFPSSVAYDSARDRLLACLGTQVWQMPLGGPTNWTPITTSGTPPSGGADAVYEPARDRLDFLRPEGLWVLTFAGTPTWRHLSSYPPPPLLGAVHVSLDAAHDRLLAHGGAGHNETWGYALGTDTWSLLEPGNTIPMVSEHAAVVVPSLDAMLILRGNPTWEFALDGSGFSPLATSGVVPPYRRGSAVIFDPVHQRVLQFGGNDGTDFNDLYALTLAGTPTWSPLTTAGTKPPPRSFATGIYDPVRDRMLIVGGGPSLESGGGPSRSDVWALSLSGTPTWSQVMRDSTIAGYYNGPAVYDSRRDRVILIGYQGYQDATMAWALPLGGPPSWSTLAGGASTPTRLGFAAAYDSTNDRVLVYGGEHNYPIPQVNTLGSLSLAPEAWGTISPAGFTPLARTEFTLVHDPRRARFVMYGGIEGSGLDVPGEWWTAPSVWFLTDHGVPLDVPPSALPHVGLALASCRLVGTDRVSVRYTVSDPGALAIDVLDIQGRRLGRGEVTATAAGTGEATVLLARAAAPGIAIVCVRQGARTATRKLAMIR